MGTGSCDLEAEICRDMPSASWRMMKASAVIPSAYGGLRTGGSDV